MWVYLPGPMVTDAAGTRWEPFPANVRLNARALAGGAYCWNTDGTVKPNPGQFIKMSVLIENLGFCGIGGLEVPDDHWNAAMAIMRRHDLEIPQGASVEQMIDNVRATAVALRQYAQNNLSISLSADPPTLRQQVIDRITAWNPQGQTQTRLRTFYLGHWSRSVTTYPSWLFPMGADGMYAPNINNANSYVSGYDALALTHPLKVADWLHLAAQCHRVLEWSRAA